MFYTFWSPFLKLPKSTTCDPEATTINGALQMGRSETGTPARVLMGGRLSHAILLHCWALSSSDQLRLSKYELLFLSFAMIPRKWINTVSFCRFFFGLLSYKCSYLRRISVWEDWKPHGSLPRWHTKLHVLLKGPLRVDSFKRGCPGVANLADPDGGQFPTIQKAVLSISAQWGLRIVTTVLLNHFVKSSLVKSKMSLYKANNI